MNFYTSDQHFGHGNILRYCDRPHLSLQEMHEDIIEKFKKRVTSRDTTYFLGDVFFKLSREKAREIMDDLPGKKILVLGNHDKWSRSKYRDVGFEEVYSYVTTMIGDTSVMLIHDPVVCCIRDLENHVILNGHVHQTWKTLGRCINVGVDVWDFYPVSEDEIYIEFANVLDKSWEDYTRKRI